MPLIRCPKCGQTYDLPGVIAVRLQNSIATCHCGEWLSGSKAAVLARLVDVEKVRELDLSAYRVDSDASKQEAAEPSSPAAPAHPRSLRVTARGARESVSTVFTIREHPLWIGRKGCHVELSEAELSIRHCSISLDGDRLVIRDAGSHMGTFLDGQKIEEATVQPGTHVLRLGSALVTIEATEEDGIPVEPIALDATPVAGDPLLVAELEAALEPAPAIPTRTVLVCIEGSLAGQEFELPPSGLIVGREGHVRVPDEFLSRKHFEVHRDEQGVVRVRDLGSRNGTFLNTLPAKNTKVQAGDEIRAGVNRFRIEERA
jgi:pSer/pThr/pTyr-binding forkhead associated (FHA) protein